MILYPLQPRVSFPQLNEVEPDVVSYCCTPSASWFHRLWVLRCFSARHGCTECLSGLRSASCQLKPVTPFSTELSYQHGVLHRRRFLSQSLNLSSPSFTLSPSPLSLPLPPSPHSLSPLSPSFSLSIPLTLSHSFSLSLTFYLSLPSFLPLSPPPLLPSVL